MPKYHPDNRYLTEYASGGLDNGLAITVKAHLEHCSDCRAHVRKLEQLGSCLFEHEQDLMNSGISPQLFDQVLTKIDSPEIVRDKVSCGPGYNLDLPVVINQLIKKPLEQLGWQRLTRRLKFSKLTSGDNRHELALYHIQAGGTIPNHKHRSDEITVVLKGSFSDEDGIYQKGDFIVRTQGEAHRPIASQHEDCLCLSALEKPIAFTGLLRFLNPWLKVSPA